MMMTPTLMMILVLLGSTFSAHLDMDSRENGNNLEELRKIQSSWLVSDSSLTNLNNTLNDETADGESFPAFCHAETFST